MLYSHINLNKSNKSSFYTFYIPYAYIRLYAQLKLSILGMLDVEEFLFKFYYYFYRENKIFCSMDCFLKNRWLLNTFNFHKYCCYYWAIFCNNLYKNLHNCILDIELCLSTNHLYKDFHGTLGIKSYAIKSSFYLIQFKIIIFTPL